MSVTIFTYPGTAYAYIDPGIMGILYQMAYAILFGGAVAWVLKPWRYLKSFVSRWKGVTEKDEKPDPARDENENGSG